MGKILVKTFLKIIRAGSV